VHILLVADGRSPITRRWISGVVEMGCQVTLVSSFPCQPAGGLSGNYILPVAFSGMGGNQIKTGNVNMSAQSNPGKLRRMISRFRPIFLMGRYWFGPITLPIYAKHFQRIINQVKPDLIHALRVPFEGMLASYAPSEIPVIVSIWGNDLTLHGKGSPLMNAWTRKTIQRANGLVADAIRDIRLGLQWGFASEKPTLVVPGSGGIDMENMNRLSANNPNWVVDILPAGMPLVINPRGFRPGSVKNEVFFKAIPLVLERIPRVYFLCTAMQGQTEAIDWLRRLKIDQHVRLLPFLRQPELWDLFLRAEITVSVSAHDGTPNTLLEAMTCGCFPVVGDIESLREWITPGVNGLLVEPNKPQALAEALLMALERPELRKRAADFNRKLIDERADTKKVHHQIQTFYRQFA
jgi:hypothetical protein